jgi:hypothetical protein
MKKYNVGEVITIRPMKFWKRIACYYLGISPYAFINRLYDEIRNFDEIIEMYELMLRQYQGTQLMTDSARIDQLLKIAKGQKEIAKNKLNDFFKQIRQPNETI